MNHKAVKAYTESRENVLNLLLDIMGAIDAESVDEATIHWGHVGDMNRRSELLRELADTVPAPQ